MRKFGQLVFVAIVALGVGFGLTGCGSSTPTGGDKMGDKMGGKLGDKMGDKMGGKMGDKMGDKKDKM